MGTPVYLLTVGWASDDQVDVGVFSTLLYAQQAAPEGMTWEENTDVIRGHRYRMWEGYTADGVHEPAWIYEYELDKSYAGAPDTEEET